MCQGFRHFSSFFASVCIRQATSSMRVKYDVPAAWMNPYYYRFCAAWMLLMNLAIRNRLLKADGIVYISQMHLASPIHCCEQWGLNDNYLAFTHLCGFSLLPLNLINRILPRNIPRWLFFDTLSCSPLICELINSLSSRKQYLSHKRFVILKDCWEALTSPTILYWVIYTLRNWFFYDSPSRVFYTSKNQVIFIILHIAVLNI